MARDHSNDRIVFLDIETTGLNPEVNDIIEIAGVISSPPFEVVEKSLSIKVKPENIQTASPVALKLNGYNEKELESAVPLKQAMQEFSMFAGGKIWCAHNASFDISFIKSKFNKVGIPLEKIGFYVFDTLSIGWALLPHGSVENYKLSTIAERFGIPREADRHEAIYGCILDMKIYSSMVKYRDSLGPKIMEFNDENKKA